MVFWLMCLDTPVMKMFSNYILNCQIFKRKISGVYPDNLCLHKKFHQKMIFFSCAKKTKNVSYKAILKHHDLSFHIDNKNVILPWNFVCQYTMSGCTSKIFLRFFYLFKYGLGYLLLLPKTYFCCYCPKLISNIQMYIQIWFVKETISVKKLFLLLLLPKTYFYQRNYFCQRQ